MAIWKVTSNPGDLLKRFDCILLFHNATNNILTRSNVKVMSVSAGGGPVSIWRVETKAVSGVISSWISLLPLQMKSKPIWNHMKIQHTIKQTTQMYI